MKKTIFTFIAGGLSCLLVMAVTAFTAGDETPSYVTLNTIEFGALYDSKIVIIYENGTTEEIPLENPTNTKKCAGNLMKIHETINMLTHKHYKLVHTISKATMATYIFEKR